MKKLFLIIIIFFVCVPVFGQVRFLPMKYDSPLTESGSFFKYDKLDHFCSHALLVMAIPTKKYNIDFWISVTAGFIFELNDGTNAQFRRTLGFSRVDFIGDVTGAIMGMFLKDIFHKFGVYILVNKDGISLKF